jgi:hypothetical protein
MMIDQTSIHNPENHSSAIIDEFLCIALGNERLLVTGGKGR